MEVHEELKSRVLPFIQKMMDFSLQLYKDGQTNSYIDDRSREQFPLPNLMKFAVKYVVDQLKNSSVISEYLSEMHHPNRTARLFKYLRNSFNVYETESMNTSFIEWSSMTCLIAAACFCKGGCEDAPNIAVIVIHEICVRENQYDEFRKLGCDI